MDILNKHFENLRIDMSPDSKIVRNALDLVKKHIIKKGMILVGGQSMDYSLRKKGMYLYGDDVVPDYDMITPNHYTDSIDIAHELIKLKYPDVNIINAMHTTTRRVRIKNIVVADVTYCPQHIFDNVSYIVYKDIKNIYPYYPMCDQIKNIACPTMGEPREVIFSRWQKDFKRMQLLFQVYNPFSLYEKENAPKINIVTNKYELNSIESKLLDIGIKAGADVMYNTIKLDDKLSIGEFNSTKQIQTLFIPSYFTGITRFVPQFKDLGPILESKHKVEYFNQIMDFPARIEVTTDSGLKIIYYVVNNMEFTISGNSISIMTLFWQAMFEYLFYNKQAIKQIEYIIKFLKSQDEKSCILSSDVASVDDNTSHAIKTQLAILMDKKEKELIPRNLYEFDLKNKKFDKKFVYSSSHYFTSITGSKLTQSEFVKLYK